MKRNRDLLSFEKATYGSSMQVLYLPGIASFDRLTIGLEISFPPPRNIFWEEKYGDILLQSELTLSFDCTI